jgi:hypothetical protein
METKECTKCHKRKPVAEFGKDSGKADGLKSNCKTCVKEAAKPESLETMRARELRKSARAAGMSLEDYLAHRAKPCAICDESGDALSPYSGNSETVLGWICRKCNRGLGNFGHDPERVRRALALYGG